MLCASSFRRRVASALSSATRRFRATTFSGPERGKCVWKCVWNVSGIVSFTGGGLAAAVASVAGLVVSDSFDVEPAPSRFFSFPDAKDLSTKENHRIDTHRRSNHP